jgi:hypothetical protein
MTGLEAKTPIRERLLAEAQVCAHSGSPMYARLLELAARDVDAGGPVLRILLAAGSPDFGPVGARLLAGLHELVLAGEAPDLACFYPSVGGDWRRQGLEEALRETSTRFSSRLGAWINRPIQANEVGRSAALLCGFHLAYRVCGLPLRLLELGSSAGLNLLWDRFFYAGPGWSWGPGESPVRLTRQFESGNPILVRGGIEIAERLGCDRYPLCSRSESDLIRMKSFIWADQAGYRFSLLEEAWRLLAAQDFSVERAEAGEWLRCKELPVPGVATVVFHSIVWEYLPARDRDAIRETIHQAGQSATASAPLAWLRLEPLGPKRIPSVRITVWPQRLDRVLAHCRFDGSGIHLRRRQVHSRAGVSRPAPPARVP